MTYQDRINRVWASIGKPKTRNLALRLGCSEASITHWRHGFEPSALAVGQIAPRLVEIEAEIQNESQTGQETTRGGNGQ